MSNEEKMVRIRVYVGRLNDLYETMTFGDTGYRAARLIECMHWLTINLKTAADREAFEYAVKSWKFWESDLAAKDALGVQGGS